MTQTDSSLHLCSPRGFRAAGVACGIKESGKPDLALLVCDRPASAAVAFTRSRVVSPAVTVGREHLHQSTHRLRAVVVNSGNANACTGEPGKRDAIEMATRVGQHVGVSRDYVLPSSTGIIGHALPMQNVRDGIDAASQQLGSSREHADAFANAILTTDLVTKQAATTVRIGGETITIAGVCKGSGMIGPMLEVEGAHVPAEATMLAYLTTDAAVSPEVLRDFHAPAVMRTFDRVTVDNHCSTNDTVALLASGHGPTVAAGDAAFQAALTDVCDALAYQIAADGEGATKVLVCRVAGARTEAEAASLARSIADSPLVKAAMHGNDPNWGRIVCIAGMAAARDDLAFDADRCELRLAGTIVFRDGLPVDFDAAALSKAMRTDRVELDLTCREGDAAAHVYGCDLSREYVAINADYHT